MPPRSGLRPPSAPAGEGKYVWLGSRATTLAASNDNVHDLAWHDDDLLRRRAGYVLCDVGVGQRGPLDLFARRVDRDLDRAAQLAVHLHGQRHGSLLQSLRIGLGPAGIEHIGAEAERD